MATPSLTINISDHKPTKARVYHREIKLLESYLEHEFRSRFRGECLQFIIDLFSDEIAPAIRSYSLTPKMKVLLPYNS